MANTEFQVKATNGMSTVEAFSIEEHEARDRDAVVFILQGDVDLHAAPELRERMDKVVDGRAHNIVVDLSGVSFIDSMTLGVLLAVSKRLRAEGGELRLVVPGEKLRRIFEITLLDQVFTLSGTRQEALASFGI